MALEPRVGPPFEMIETALDQDRERRELPGLVTKGLIGFEAVLLRLLPGIFGHRGDLARMHLERIQKLLDLALCVGLCGHARDVY